MSTVNDASIGKILSDIPNFSDKDVRGRDYRGMDLSRVSFRRAKIAGADFTDANLQGADFCGVRAGLQLKWIFILIGFALFIALPVALFLVVISVTTIATVTFGDFAGGFIGAAIVSIGFMAVSILIIFEFKRKSYGEVWTSVWVALGIASVAWGVIASLFGNDALLGAIAGGGASATAIVGAIGTIWAIAGSWAVIGWISVPIWMLIAISWIYIFSQVLFFFGSSSRIEATLIAIAIALTIFGVGAFISKLALTGDPKFAFVRKLSIAYAASGGASFCNADLTDANFKEANLSATDFRGANLKRALWHRVSNLKQARLGDTYLEDLEVQKLLISGDGKDKDFSSKDLKGVNLEKANLRKAIFDGANLNEAVLREASLQDASLVQTQLDGTDLTGACLTGATIEDWGITIDTVLEDVRCKYVFMRSSAGENIVGEDDKASNQRRRRKPDGINSEFDEGGFASFIAPMIETLDLYHNQDVDPRAVAMAFYSLQDENPEAQLEIISMERRGNDLNKFLIRAAASRSINLSDLYEQYFDKYENFRSLPPEAQVFISQQRERIESLTKLVETASGAPKYKYEYDFSHARFAGGFAETVYGNQVGVQYSHSLSGLQTLSEAISEVRTWLQLIEDLELPAPLNQGKLTEFIPLLRARKKICEKQLRWLEAEYEKRLILQGEICIEEMQRLPEAELREKNNNEDY